MSTTLQLPAVVDENEKRAGVGHLLRSYTQMVRFEAINMKSFLVATLIIQTMMGAGMAIMYGFYFGEMPEAAKTFLVSGIPAHRWDDTYDFMWSLPVPRIAAGAATFTVYMGVALPGAIVALVVSSLVYGVQLDPSVRVVPAVLMATVMATSVGYAMGHSVKRPEFVNLLTNLLIFTILLFSPLVVPIEFFPEWLQSAHRVLPFWHMANLVRDGLAPALVEDVATSYLIALAWTVGSMVIASRVIARRD
jgi:ABC-2 type transport system permease protein